MRKIIRIARISSWWSVKLPIFIVVSLLPIVSMSNTCCVDIETVILAVISILFCAIFISMLNDYTDYDDDIKAGKQNSFSENKQKLKYVLIFIGIVCFALPFLFKIQIFQEFK